MFTNDEAQALIKAKKYLENPSQLIDFGLSKIRIDLWSDEEPNYKFFIEINPNQKIRFKLTLHCQEKCNNIGLLRIDYNGSHLNPSYILPTLPDFLKPFASREFRREAHIHFYVEDYKPLVWAMPLSEFTFKTKTLINDADYVKALMEFAKLLNVQSKLNIQTQMMI